MRPWRDEAVWEDPTWYRGLTLIERTDPNSASTVNHPSASDAATAVRRLERWKAQSPFDEDAFFDERLGQDGLAEQDLLALLAESPTSLRARIGRIPDWLNALREAYQGYDTDKQIAELLQETSVEHPLASCLPAIGALLERSLNSIQREIQALRQQWAVLPFDAELIPRFFVSNIAFELLFKLSKPVILEMHIARIRGDLHGATPEERFTEFVSQLSEDGLIVPLLAKFPVLARQLLQSIDHWAAYLKEFLCHFCADWATIRSTFTPERDPGLLVGMEAGLGDRHRRGRSVIVLQFESGMKLLYKPKPLAVDLHFQELLGWLNERGATPPLRPLNLVDRGQYGWSEFVVASPCSTREEVERFYERLGGCLALLYALDAVDLHNENVIAVGEHPVLIDLEALFHPRIEGSDPSATVNLASHAMDQSVWQVGLLPRRLWGDDESPGVDMSGLGGGPGQLLPHQLYRWADTGTDQMQLVRQRVEMPEGENRPRLNGQDVFVADYREAFVTGFTRMYRLLCAQREALLTEQLPRFAGDEIRVVVRSTRIYATLLFESFHPDLLRDALERERFFDRIWREVEQRAYLTRIIPAERHDLIHGDIPLFTTFPNSRAIFTSEGESIPDFLDVPSLELVRQRIQRLGEDDLAKQTWIVEASLATLLMDGDDTSPRLVPARRVTAPVQRGKLLDLARAAGRRLDELALQNDAGAYWLSVNYVHDRAWSLFPTGTDLYNGTSGIALFLGYLGMVTDDQAITLLAQRALATLRSQVADQEKFSVNTGIGAFDGLCSPIYSLTHLGALWNEPELHREAERLSQRVPALIAKDDRRDIINGAAGSILCLLSLHSVCPSHQLLDIAIQCGDHLLATAQRMPRGIAWETLSGERPLGGFSHGTAGIAYSLFRLAAVSGQQRFHQSAIDALTYDRSLFVPELNNWADLRVFPTRTREPEPTSTPPHEQALKSMVAWCHGAPGIGLGRLGALAQIDDAQIRDEIDVALDTTVRQGLGGNHSLCHGALGNLELVLAGSQLLDRPGDHSALEASTATVVGSIEANGWVSAVPFGVETPGLMIGLAGMGYAMLRLAEPERVPSVLLLEPPFRGVAS